METEKIHIEKKEPNGAGRRTAILFDDDINRQLFIETAQAMLDRYYDHSPENTKKNIVLSGTLRMGKTLFWAIIHRICLKTNIINNDTYNHNLDPFVKFLTAQFGKNVIGDRSAIQKKEQLLMALRADSNIDFSFKKDFDVIESDKYRKVYKRVLHCWNEALNEVKSKKNGLKNH